MVGLGRLLVELAGVAHHEDVGPAPERVPVDLAGMTIRVGVTPLGLLQDETDETLSMMKQPMSLNERTQTGNVLH